VKNHRFVLCTLGPAFLFLACFYLYPVVANIRTSLTDTSLLQMRTGGDFVGLANYRELLTSSDFLHVLWNTAFWLTFVGVGARIVVGLLLALVMNSRTVARYRLRTIARIALVVPWATPPIVSVIIFKWMLDPRSGDVNHLLVALGINREPIAFLGSTQWVWPVILLIVVWNTLPLVTLSFVAALQSLPGELVEAASMDGANAWEIARYVYLPHLRPSIVVLVLMSTFWTFNNFVYVWLTTGAGPGYYTNVMATDVYIKAFVDGRMGYSSAVGVVMALLMLAFGLVYLRVVARREFKEVLQ
jgi:multiple sugar transport system permease protein